MTKIKKEFKGKSDKNKIKIRSKTNIDLKI